MRACIFETSQSKSEKKKKNAREGERAIPSKFIRAQLSNKVHSGLFSTASSNWEQPKG